MSEQAVHDWIRKTIANNDVVLFMKGTKDFPQCGFSAPGRADPRPPGRRPTRTSTCWRTWASATASRPSRNWPTIPQLYVKGEFVGGCDIVREMFQEGELQQLLDDKGIAYDRAKMTA